jgi:hypothetical protein
MLLRIHAKEWVYMRNKKDSYTPHSSLPPEKKEVEEEWKDPEYG